MRLVTIDLESHYATDYSLSRMSPLEYVMDDRFEIISCAIKVDHWPTDVFFGEDAVRRAFRAIAGTVEDALMIGHNMSGFDAYVCAYRLGLRPRMWGCTMAMARPLHAKTIGLGLGKLVAHYRPQLEAMGIAGVKDNTALVQTRGKRLADFTPAELDAMREYNRNDTDQCWGLFRILRKHYTSAELWQIDALTRMRTEPQFVLDVPLLETAASVERSRKHAALLDAAKHLRAAGATCSELDWSDEAAVTEFVRAETASSARFAALLTHLGVEVPMKPSPTNPERLVPALAKTDEAFLALQEHPDPVVASAARTRLDVKSTILETRIQKFLTAGALAGGRVPIPIRYCGADTTGRDSGEEYNPQNLPRVNPDRPATSDALRKSLRAPKGHLVIVADQSGIELRVNHFLWKVPSSMALYRASPDKADLYRAFAAENLYKVRPEEITKTQRNVGKIAQLGLQFGSAAATFQRVAKIMGGLDLELERGPDTGPELTAQEVVSSWRDTYYEIVQGWRTCDAALGYIYDGREVAVDPWELVVTTPEGFRLPSGRLIRYPDLRREDDHWPDGRPRRSWVYAAGRHKTFIHGAKAVENCVAGDTPVLTDSGWKPLKSVQSTDLVHDGVEFVAHAGLVKKGVQTCMELDGVWMTPDHKVLTDHGWVRADEAEEPYRPDIRLADGGSVRGSGCEAPPHAVAVGLHLRHPGGTFRRAGDPVCPLGLHTPLRVPGHSESPAQREENARYVPTPGVCRVAEHERPVPTPFAPVVGELRRAGYRGVRAMAHVVRRLLAGHGRQLPAGAGPGPHRQRRPLLAGELPLGYAPRQHDEQARVDPARGRSGAESRDGHRADDTVQPHQERVASGGADTPSRRAEQVFDILNCGPRHRFVVRGASGPYIVHNCVQALARDSVFDCSLEFFRRTGLRPALRVHDELVYVVPEARAQELLDELQAVMRTPPTWWPDLVVWSEGDAAPSYGEAK